MKSDSTNIELIIDGCLQGRSIAQRRLFDMKYGLVMSICRRYSNRKEESKEMLNDTFYTVFKFIDRYDKERPFDPWLRRLCVNCCLQYLRKYFKGGAMVELNESHLGYESEQYAFSTTDEQPHMHLISKLPPAYKTVLNLFVIEEYGHQEIADMLSISVGTSKSNLHRAKRSLADMLERDTERTLKFKSDG